MHTRPSALWAAVAVALTGALFFQVVQRGQAASGDDALPAGSYGIGLLDLERALQHCTARSDAAAALARDRRAFDEQLASQRTEAKELAKRMAKLPVGSQERFHMEGRLRTMAKQTRAQTDQKNREFAQRDAQLRFDAYQQVRQAVAEYAAEHRLRLVLKHASQQADLENTAALELALASPVLYHDALDITDEVLKTLGRKSRSLR